MLSRVVPPPLSRPSSRLPPPARPPPWPPPRPPPPPARQQPLCRELQPRPPLQPHQRARRRPRSPHPRDPVPGRSEPHSTFFVGLDPTVELCESCTQQPLRSRPHGINQITKVCFGARSAGLGCKLQLQQTKPKIEKRREEKALKRREGTGGQAAERRRLSTKPTPPPQGTATSA